MSSSNRSGAASRDIDLGSPSFSGSRSAANVNTSRIKATQQPTDSFVAPPSRQQTDVSHSSSKKNNATVVPDPMLSPREREILMQLLVQITDFVARKQQLSKSRANASTHFVPDWRKDFRRSRHDGSGAADPRNSSKDLFEVVIRVCEERMQRLHDEQQEVRSQQTHCFHLRL